MSSGTGKPGQALASLGGLGLGVSLWLPWYTIHIPQAALNSLAQMSQQWGTLGPLVRSGAELVGQLGPIQVTAWDAFKTTPAVLLGAAIIGGGLALLALTDRAGNTSQLTMTAGAVGAVLVVYRIAVPPWQPSFVGPAWGIWVALLSSLLMLAGGSLSKRAAEAPEPMMTSRPVLDPAPPAATGWVQEAATGPALSMATDPALFGGPADSPTTSG